MGLRACEPTKLYRLAQFGREALRLFLFRLGFLFPLSRPLSHCHAHAGLDSQLFGNVPLEIRGDRESLSDGDELGVKITILVLGYPNLVAQATILLLHASNLVPEVTILPLEHLLLRYGNFLLS